MNLSWSDFKPFPQGLKTISASAGVYRIQTTEGDVGYLGQSQNLRGRLSSQSNTFSGGSYSNVAFGQTLPHYQRLEVENDLLGHYYQIHRAAPKHQFRS